MSQDRNETCWGQDCCKDKKHYQIWQLLCSIIERHSCKHFPRSWSYSYKQNLNLQCWQEWCLEKKLQNLLIISFFKKKLERIEFIVMLMKWLSRLAIDAYIKFKDWEEFCKIVRFLKLVSMMLRFAEQVENPSSRIWMNM